MWIFVKEKHCNIFSCIDGGERGIRTLDSGYPRITAFETVAFDHSAISPYSALGFLSIVEVLCEVNCSSCALYDLFER